MDRKSIDRKMNTRPPFAAMFLAAMFLAAMRRLRAVAGLAGLLTLAPAAAQAVPVLVVDRGSGLASPEVVLDFGPEDLFPLATPLTDQFEAGFGVSFGPNFFFFSTLADGPSFSDGRAQSPGDGTPFSSIFFSTPVTDAVFTFTGTRGVQINVEAYLEGVFVQNNSFPAENVNLFAPHFYGFEDGLFDELRFDWFAGQTIGLLDNLQFNRAPVRTTGVAEPGALALFGAGLVGFAMLRRRKVSVSKLLDRAS